MELAVPIPAATRDGEPVHPQMAWHHLLGHHRGQRTPLGGYPDQQADQVPNLAPAAKQAARLLILAARQRRVWQAERLGFMCHRCKAYASKTTSAFPQRQMLGGRLQGTAEPKMRWHKAPGTHLLMMNLIIVVSVLVLLYEQAPFTPAHS